MFIRKAGHIIGSQNGSMPYNCYSTKVTKIGYVLQQTEKPHISKSTNLTDIALRGNIYYQVISNAGACDMCEEHNSAIYPIADAKEGVNLPPFHPNCKCSIQEYSSENPNYDPWRGEVVFWLDVMYGEGTMEQKAQKLLDFYYWSEFSVSFIASILSSIDDIDHIGKRIEEFFRLLRLENSNQDQLDKDETFRLPSVHFEDKKYPLSPLEVTLPSEWLNYVNVLGTMLGIDYYLVIAFILHESGGNPLALNTDSFDDPMQQASGLMQIIPYWHYAYQSGGQYYGNYSAVIAYAEQNGADINNLFDPLGNITIGMMMLNEQRKLCKDTADMRELVGRQGQGYNDPTTTEILYYRDLLAKQNGLDPWYSDEYYLSRMKK